MKLLRYVSPIILGILLLLGIGINVGTIVISQKQKYLTFNYGKRYISLKQVYNSSQYVNKHPKGWIPDEIVNAYAGGALIKGADPILIIPDTPPLGKYLIGLSSLLFNNENIITVICALFSLILLYFLGKQILSSRLLALVPPFILSFEPIFKNQIIYSPLYDIIQLVFLLGGFYFFNKGCIKKKGLVYFVITSIFLGLFISTKFYITGVTILGAYVLVLLFNKQRKKFIEISFTFVLAPFILLMSYFRVFAFNSNIHNFIGIQKWIFLYHRSQLILPLSIWPLLLLNKWYVWYGTKPVISDPQWQLTWPFITIVSITTCVLYLLKRIKKTNGVEVLMCWIVLYLLFFSFGQITSRYFVILIPVLYLISWFGIVCFWRKYFSRKKIKNKAKLIYLTLKKKKFFTISNCITFIILFFGFLFSIAPLLHKGFFPTLDDIQVLRIDMMTRELRSGQFPVRYVNELGNKGGYFLFNYYFPMVYYIGSFLHIVSIPLVKATKLTFILAYFVAASGMFLLLKKYTDKIIATLGSILFFTSSYFAFDVYTRGDLAETLGLALIPWVFWSFLLVKEKHGFKYILFAAITFAFLITIHMMIGYSTVLILIFLFLLPPWNKHSSLRFVLALCLSMCFSAFYWLPVMMETHLTGYSKSYFGVISYKTNFLSIFDLVGFHQFATGFKPPLLGLGLFMGVIFAFVMVILKKKVSTISFFALGGFLITLVFISKISMPIWSVFPYLTLMQFPWRFLTDETVLAILSLGVGLSYVRNPVLKLFIGILFLLPAITLQRSYLRPSTYNYISVYYAEDICSTSTWDHEFLPKWTKQCLPKPPKHQQSTYPLLQTNNKSLMVKNILIQNNGRIITFQSIGKYGEITVARYYFPGWKAFLDNHEIPVMPIGKFGLLHITVPSGKHFIQIKLVNTPIETIGNIISLVSIFGLLLVFILMSIDSILTPKK